MALIYARFFTFNVLSSTFFIFAQKLFDNNLNCPSAFLWIIFLVAFSFGAAIYARFSARFDQVLPWLFPSSLLYLLVVSALFLELTLPWSWRTAYPHLFFENWLFFNILLGLSGIIIFAPVWWALGMMEMNVYRDVSHIGKTGRWAFYFIGIMGFAAGLLVNAFVLPVPSPLWLGIFLLCLCFVFSVVLPGRYERLPIIIMAVTFFALTQQHLYVKDPARVIGRSPYPFGAIESRTDAWTRNFRLTVMRLRTGVIGFYNGMFYWFTPFAGQSEEMDLFIASSLPEGSTVAVLGAGGGAQVGPLLERNPARIFAVDIVCGLFDMAHAFGVRALADPRVKPVVKEGRKFMRESDERFDLIYLPQTGSRDLIARGLFSPGVLLFTQEAIAAYSEKLKPTGIIAISKRAFFLEGTVFFTNYMRTLRKAGFYVASYAGRAGKNKGRNIVLTVASKDAAALSRLDAKMALFPSIHPYGMGAVDQGDVISDDKPFFASQVYSDQIWFIVSVCFLCFIIIVLFIKRLSVDGAFLFPPLLCGMNYALLMLSYQLMLFFLISNPLDASLFGNLWFLVFLWLGALVYERRLLLNGIAVLCLIGSSVMKIRHPFPLLMILTIYSGGFFPRLLHLYSLRDKIPVLLVLDGLGAALAGIIYIVVPIVWGIRIFLLFVVIICAISFYAIVMKRNRRVEDV